jgi:outer membrane biosynthesis protein TonB
MPRALKTFHAHLGFYDTIVAVPSRAAALRAWGSRQDLFRDGFARPSEDRAAIAAALAKPGVVLRRPAGSNASYSENPVLPQVPKAPRKPKPAKEPTAKVTPVPLPKPAKTTPPKIAPKPKLPPPNRRDIDAAEKAQAELRREEERVIAALAKRKAALDDEELRTRNAFRARRQKAQAALAQAHQVYKEALNRG